MTNPYAKHFQDDDQPKGDTSVNPYAKHFADAPKPATKPAKRNYALREVPGAMWRNSGKGITELGRNVRDAYADPGAAIYNVASGALDMRNALAEMTPGKALDVAKAIAGHYGESYAGYDPKTGTFTESPYEATKRTMAEHPYAFAADAASLATLPVGGGLTLGGKAAATAGQAAAKALPTAARAARAVGNSIPAGKALAKGAQYLAVPMHAINDAAAQVPKVARYVEDVRHPMNAFVGKLTEGNPAAMMNALANKKQIVPGVNPTAAQVVTSQMPATHLAAADKAARAHLSSPAVGAKNAQNAAILDDVRSISGGPMENYDIFGGNLVTSADEADRIIKKLAEADYAPSKRRTFTADDDLVELFNRDVVPDVFKRVESAVSNEGRTFATGKNIPAHTVPSTVLGPNGKPIPMHVPAQYAKYKGEDLHKIKLAFDDEAFAKVQTHGIESVEAKAILKARDAFIKWFEKQDPSYAEARKKFAVRSSVHDRMKLRDTFESILTEPLKEGETLKMRAAAFANALDGPHNAALVNSTVRRATGKPRKARVAEMVTPRESERLSRVKAELARMGIADDQALAGANHTGDIDTILSDAMHVRPDHWWTRPFVNHGNNKLRDKAAQMLQTPEGLEGAIRKYMTREDEIAGLDKAVRNALALPRIANRYPTLYNAYGAAKDDQRNALNR